MTDLSSGQVAKLLGVRRETVWRWARRFTHAGMTITDYEVVRGSGHLRFTPDAVEALWAEHAHRGRHRTPPHRKMRDMAAWKGWSPGAAPRPRHWGGLTMHVDTPEAVKWLRKEHGKEEES